MFSIWFTWPLVVMITYYPLNGDFTFKDPSVVEPEFSYLVSMMDKPIYVTEIGYASGDRVGSIEQQKQFVINAFKAWDANPSIKLMSFVWMDDVPESMKEVFSTYYGFSNENFIEFLSTLGLRHEDKSPKDAWYALIEETRSRGWHK